MIQSYMSLFISMEDKMKERKRIASILRTFAKDVEKCETLDKYGELELAAIYVWGTMPDGLQVPAIIRKANIDAEGLSTPEIERVNDE